jgi:hypothetical protein
MALKDRIAKETLKQPCAYILMVNAMKAEDQKALAEAWAKGISQRIILRSLRAEGYKTSNEAILAHRSGACKCQK